MIHKHCVKIKYETDISMLWGSRVGCEENCWENEEGRENWACKYEWVGEYLWQEK